MYVCDPGVAPINIAQSSGFRQAWAISVPDVQHLEVLNFRVPICKICLLCGPGKQTQVWLGVPGRYYGMLLWFSP